jgi:hypothetical protein
LTDSEAYREGMAASHIALVDVLVKRTPDADPEPKLQGVVAIPDWDWWIGTGFSMTTIDPVPGREARDWINRPKRNAATFAYYTRRAFPHHSDCL